MRALSAIVFSLIFCVCSQAIGQQQGFVGHQNFYGSDASNTWEFKTNLLIMDLKESRQNTVIVQDNTLNTVLLTAGGLSALDTGVGIDASMTKNSNDGHRHQFRSVFVGWDGENNFNSTGNLTNIFTPGLATDTITIGPNQLDLFSVEYNLKKAVNPGITLFAGPRFISIQDHFEADTSTDVGGGLTFTTESEVTVDNLMFGGQVGTDLNVIVARNLQAAGSFRAGFYATPTKFQMVTSDSLNPGISNTTTSRETNEALAAEVSGSLIWEVFPGALSVEAGYHAMWFDNVGRSFRTVCQ